MCCQVWESLTFFVTCSFHKVESRFLLNWTRSNIGWRPKNIPPGDPERRPTGKEDKSFFLLRKTGDANYWKASPDKKYPKMGLFLQLKNREQDLLGKEQPQMTCENSASSNGHTWVFVHRAGNKTPFIQSKTSKWWLLPDVLRPKKKKKSTMSSKRSLSLLVALCQIITEPGLLQQLNSNSGTNHHGTNSPWREAQKALRITCMLCCIPVCQAWVPLEEWQATPFFFFLLNLLFCSGV